MSELKKCPFCRGVPAVVEDGYKAIAVHCFNCGADITAETEARARTLWNRRAQPSEKPEPLTLDELRGMGGESVWIEESNLWYGGNGVVSLEKDRVIDPDDPNGHWPFENYGEWIAFRSKPKEDV